MLAAALLLFVIPWPTRLQGSALLRPSEVFPLHAPAHARLAAMPVSEGGDVKAGDVMLEFSGAENASRIAALQAEIARLEWQTGASGFDAEQRARSMVLAEQLTTAQAQLDLLQVEAARMRPQAPFDGKLTDIAPDLAPGVWDRTIAGSSGSDATIAPPTPAGVIIGTTAKRSGIRSAAHVPHASSIGKRTARSTPTASMYASSTSSIIA